MNVVMITTGERPELLEQSISSLIDNAVLGSPHLTLVLDGDGSLLLGRGEARVIVNKMRQGASASRNIGAGSTPKYRRHEYVMFVDDDVYMMPRWDAAVVGAMTAFDGDPLVVSGHAHPFNHSVGVYVRGGEAISAANVLSTVHMVMPWEIWDKVGYFVEPGGPGGSEDVDWCRRATEMGYGLAVTEPMCVVHCGLTSSSGKRIVGYEHMVAVNNKLIESRGLTGKVVVV